MKKLLIFITLVCFTTVGYSQIKGGIKAGLNFANVQVDNGPDSKTGYHFGGYLQVGLAGIFIQPEILFSAKGAEDVDLNYVEVPILLRKNFAKVLNIHAGPQFGVLLNAESDTGFGTVDIKDDLKSLDLSAVVGAGVSLPGGLNGGLRYVLGLSDINDFDGAPEAKNRTFQIYIGYKLFGD